MFSNYLKIAWRQLWKNKSFSLINILGLSLGIASALLIIFHVKEELAYDKDIPGAADLFRVTQEGKGDDSREWAATGFPLGATLQENLPEVKAMVRFHRPYPYQLLTYTNAAGETKRFQEKGGLFADSNALQVFGRELIKGNAATALSTQNGIVISEELAHKYFGDEDPLGKTLQEERWHLPMTVTGVLKNRSAGSHLVFDYLIAMNAIHYNVDQGMLDNRTWSGFYTYLQLRDGSRQAVLKKLPAITAKYFAEPGQSDAQVLAGVGLNLQPVSSIHLHSKLEKELSANSDIAYVYIFSVAAFLILLLAAMNFVNLFTAQAFNRMKEVGLRKVVGATKPQLVKQFLGESLLTTVLSAALALFFFKQALPFYNNFTGKHFQFINLAEGNNLLLLTGLILTITVCSGLYPAWFVSRFNPISSLKGKRDTQSSVHFVRKGLIVLQFSVAVFMIFATIVVYRQMQLFHNKDLGFDKEQLVAVTMYDDMWQKFGALQSAIKKEPGIEQWAITSTLPGERFGMQPFSVMSAAGRNEETPSARILMADDQLLSTLHLPLAKGRNFTDQFPDIKKVEFILNEAAVRLYKMDNPVGQRVVLDRDTGDVVGVVKDFNFASLHSPVEPLVIEYNPYRANYLLLKARPQKLQSIMANMEKVMKDLYPSSVFTYTFIDEKLNQLYDSENRMSRVIQVFAAFALFISAMGLFGLSAYAIRLRIKEVGIRKTLGASVSGVVLLLSKDFVVLVAFGILIAWPIAWWATSRWLEGFAYRVDVDWGVFLLSGIFALLIGVMTISYEAVKAAMSNPVKSLKTE